MIGTSVMKELKSSILLYAFDVKLVVIFSNKITLIASILLELVVKKNRYAVTDI